MDTRPRLLGNFNVIPFVPVVLGTVGLIVTEGVVEVSPPKLETIVVASDVEGATAACQLEVSNSSPLLTLAVLSWLI